MPSLGADMEAGTVIEWRVAPGDAVHRGDIVAEVETEKGLVEVEIWEDGVVEQLCVGVGEKVPIGTVLALLRPPGAAAAPPGAGPTIPLPATAPAPAPPLPPAPSVPAAAAVRAPAVPPSTRARVSPLARRRAAALGVDLAAVRGTGAGGAITAADIEQAGKAALPPSPPAAPSPAAPPRAVAATAEQHAAMRRAIGAAMARSKREIPHYYLGTEIDMSRALAWLGAQNASRPVTERLLYSVLLLKAVALAVREVPEMNGLYVDGRFTPGGGVHVGVAVSLRQGGLVAPAIHDVDRKPVDELMASLRALVQRARAGVLRSSELSDATITVTSLGEQGVETVFGVIYPPQVALVGFGAVVERPWAEHGRLAVRPLVMATLAGDHRVSDGHRGARFLAAIDRLMQQPEKL